MLFPLSSPDIKQLKRVLANRLPGASSSRLTEAMARGLRFSTNAALLSALRAGPVNASPDDAAFRSFLLGRDGADVPDGTMSAALSELAIAAVMAREPDLSRDGMRSRHNGTLFPTSRPAMLDGSAVAEFQRAVEWLGTVRQTSRINSKRVSYGYKHEVERYHAAHYPGQLEYVSNGMFIAAALHMRFRIKRDDWDSPNVFLNLLTVEDEKARKQPAGNLARQLRGTKNLQAWRNLMVAGINAGLTQNLFGLAPDDNRWSGDGCIYRFDFDGIPGIASVRDIDFGELSVTVAVIPSARAEEWIGSFNAGFEAGDGFASGFFGRQKGAWLQTTATPTGKFRRAVLDRVSAVQVSPLGFADSGKFMM